MPPINPNELSNADYWARVNGRAAPDSPQGIAAIAAGSANWGAAPQANWLAQLASDIASRGGIAVQQNGYDATAAAPVAAGPAWAGPSPVPAYPRSGANVTMPGSRAGWEQWGIPPVIMQSTPYATAAYRTYTDPYGQIGVQPLIGFPSAYPHVLSGVPNSPFRVQGFINALLPQGGFMPFMGMPFMGMPFMGMPQTAMPAQPRAQGGGGGAAPARASAVQRVSARRSPFLYGDTDTMPLPASYQRPNPQTTQSTPAAQVPQINRPLDGTYLPPAAPAIPQVNRPFDGSYLPPVAPPAPQQTPQPQIPSVSMQPSFTSELMTPEEAAETADGMYIDPNKSLMQNLLEGLGAVSLPLSLGAGPLLYSAAPRVLGGAVIPEAGALPSAAARMLP